MMMANTTVLIFNGDNDLKYRNKVLLFITQTANEHIRCIMEKGFANPGKNGPFGQKDTPIRNSAHWLIVYSYLWKETNKDDYKKTCFVLYNYLKGEFLKSKYGVLKSFDEQPDYQINGIIGQTYVSESLLYFGSVFGDQEALEIATKIYVTCPYNKHKHRWEVVDINGVNVGIDNIITHQLWHAAIGSELFSIVHNECIKIEVDDFVNNVDKIIRLNSGNLIVDADFKYSAKQLIKGFIFKMTCYKNPMKFDPLVFERGYHLYHLYALTILKRNGFISRKLDIIYDKALQTVGNLRLFEKKIGYCNDYSRRNIYAFGYNSPAFVYPYIFGSRDLDFANSLRLLDDQINYIRYKQLKADDYLFDEDTLLARMYELIRTLDLLKISGY